MENRNIGKAFSKVNVGNYLYWCTEKMDYISKSLVINVSLVLDGKHVPACCDQIIYTNDDIEVTMMSCMMDQTDAYIFRHPKTDDLIYVGTTPRSVASLVLEELNSKIKRLQSFKGRFESNLAKYGI